MLAAPGRMTTGLVRDDRGAEPAPSAPPTRDHARPPRAAPASSTSTARTRSRCTCPGQMTMEAQYLANKLAKGFIRTTNIESNSRLCMASAGSGYKQSLGADGPPGSYDDFDHADVFLVIGSNMADCHPVLFLRLLDRVAPGATLIVVDPRRTATADKAGLFLQIRPGTDIALLNGLLHLVAADGGARRGVHRRPHRGLGRTCRRSSPTTRPTWSPSITGIPEADLRAAARLIGVGRQRVSCWTMGLNQSTHGTWNTNAICNLHLATGAICRTGSGPLSLTGQPNAMGGREMGYMGPGLPGPAVGARRRRPPRSSRTCGDSPPGTIRAEGGTGHHRPVRPHGRRRDQGVLDHVHEPDRVGRQPQHGDRRPGGRRARHHPGRVRRDRDQRLRRRRAAGGDVGRGRRRDGQLRARRHARAARPSTRPATPCPDWQLIAAVACEMGFADAFTYASAEEVFAEISPLRQPGDRLRPARRDATTGCARARCSGRRRPAGPTATRSATSTPTAGCASPTPSGRAVFHARPHVEPAELPDDDYPFMFNTGRLQHQWHTMTKTGKVGPAQQARPRAVRRDPPGRRARRSASRAGDVVEVASRRGRAVLPAVVSDRVQPGNCSRRSTGTTSRRVPQRQRGDRTTPSTRSRSSPS